MTSRKRVPSRARAREGTHLSFGFVSLFFSPAASASLSRFIRSRFFPSFSLSLSLSLSLSRVATRPDRRRHRHYRSRSPAFFPSYFLFLERLLAGRSRGRGCEKSTRPADRPLSLSRCEMMMMTVFLWRARIPRACARPSRAGRLFVRSRVPPVEGDSRPFR